jgi:hypothetical protein
VQVKPALHETPIASPCIKTLVVKGERNSEGCPKSVYLIAPHKLSGCGILSACWRGLSSIGLWAKDYSQLSQLSRLALSQFLFGYQTLSVSQNLLERRLVRTGG